MEQTNESEITLEENQIVEAPYVYEAPDIEMEGGALQMEGGFPKKKEEVRQQFILFRAFACVYRNTMNFLGALWRCEDGKCKPTILGWIVILLLITLFIYVTFFTGGKKP